MMARKNNYQILIQIWEKVGVGGWILFFILYFWLNFIATQNN